MTYIFYDTETTGVDIAFDQILQFAAIATDDNFVEKGRFEMRCRLLPWVVPSPGALLVTGTPTSVLYDPSLPNHFEMMGSIKNWLSQWGAAVYVGYNSIRFDEPLLHRAFWQTLNEPYLTVTNGNSRLDLLPIARAIAFLRPEAIAVPTNETGKVTFKLDRLAPINGFNSHNAHDALGDVEATIFVAKRIAERAPDVWEVLSGRTSKSAVLSTLIPGTIVYVLGHSSGNPSMWWGQRIDRDDRASQTMIGDLSLDWARVEKLLLRGAGLSATAAEKYVRKLASNKSPVLFTEEEAKKLFSKVPGKEITDRANVLKEAVWTDKFLKILGEQKSPPVETSRELEQTIYEGFASKADAALMVEFQASDWAQRANIARRFSDDRFRRIAARIIYAEAPAVLSEDEKLRVKSGIRARLLAPAGADVPWRSIAKAKAELDAGKEGAENQKAYREIEKWLDDLQQIEPA